MLLALMLWILQRIIAQQRNTFSLMETYYVETCGRTYFNVEDNVIHAHGKRITMPKQKLLDFIATAKELGIIAGKL